MSFWPSELLSRKSIEISSIKQIFIKEHKFSLNYRDDRSQSDIADRQFIQFHLELEGKMTLHESHDISEEIEDRILKKFKRAEVIIHQDPAELYGKE